MKFLKHLLLVITLLFSTFYLSAQCGGSDNVWNNSWTSCAVSASPNTARGNSHWLLYEFTEAQVIDSLHIWNANKTGESYLGAKNIIIDYSEDGNNWTEMGEYVIPQANESDDYEGYDGVALGGLLVKKVLVTCSSNYNSENNDCVSLSEIQFQVSELEDEVLDEEELEVEEEIDFLNLYPNPFLDFITISGAESASISIYDVHGKLLFNKIVINKNESLNLSSLSPGLYYVVSVLQEKKSVFKVVKK